MKVIEHRPPLKRIETDLKKRTEQPTIDIDCIAKFTEQERIWSLLQQSARGCNSVGGEGCLQS